MYTTDTCFTSLWLIFLYNNVNIRFIYLRTYILPYLLLYYTYVFIKIIYQQAHCESDGGHLIDIKTSAVNDAISSWLTALNVGNSQYSTFILITLFHKFQYVHTCIGVKCFKLLYRHSNIVSNLI